MGVDHELLVLLRPSLGNFNHTSRRGGILAYQPERGKLWSTIEDMNEALSERWNACVKPGDIIYHLGDFAWRGVPGTVTDVEGILKRLNGQKFLIIGTHDAEAVRLKKYWCQQILIKSVEIEGQHVVMGHYAQRVWSRSHFGSFFLYGHSHGHLPPFGKSFDIGVDTCHGEGHVPYSPYSWDEVKTMMASLVDNWVDERYTKREERICHVTPSCEDVTRCRPHEEDGPVEDNKGRKK